MYVRDYETLGTLLLKLGWDERDIRGRIGCFSVIYRLLVFAELWIWKNG